MALADPLPLNCAVRSFLSVFGAPSRQSPVQQSKPESGSLAASQQPSRFETPSPDTPSPQPGTSPAVRASDTPPRAERLSSRPESTLFTNFPPLADISGDTPPELQPIFSLLNSHANKLYHEGYFLKLNDLDTRGCSLIFGGARMVLI